MARKNETETMTDETEANTGAETTAETNAGEGAGEGEAVAPKQDRRIKQLMLPDGTLRVRTEFIRELWASCEYSRAAIRDYINKECKERDGSALNIPFQTVFQATHDQPGPTDAQHDALKKADAKRRSEVRQAAKAAAAADAGTGETDTGDAGEAA